MNLRGMKRLYNSFLTLPSLFLDHHLLKPFLIYVVNPKKLCEIIHGVESFYFDILYNNIIE